MVPDGPEKPRKKAEQGSVPDTGKGGCPKLAGQLTRRSLLCQVANSCTRQNGDDEGALSFDPTNKKHAALAVKVTGASPKRQLSAEHKAKPLAANQFTRFTG